MQTTRERSQSRRLTSGPLRNVALSNAASTIPTIGILGPSNPSRANRGQKEAWVSRQFTPGLAHENVAKDIQSLREYIDFYCRSEGTPLRADSAALAEEHGVEIHDVTIGGSPRRRRRAQSVPKGVGTRGLCTGRVTSS